MGSAWTDRQTEQDRAQRGETGRDRGRQGKTGRYTAVLCSAVCLSDCLSSCLSNLSIHLSVSLDLPICPSICPSICQSPELSDPPGFDLSICPFVRLSALRLSYLSVCLSISLSLASIFLSICLSIYLYLSLSLPSSLPPPRCPSPGQKPAVCYLSGCLVRLASGAWLSGLTVSICPLVCPSVPYLSIYPLLSILSIWPLLCKLIYYIIYIYPGPYPLSVWTLSIWARSVCTLSAWTRSAGPYIM